MVPRGRARVTGARADAASEASLYVQHCALITEVQAAGETALVQVDVCLEAVVGDSHPEVVIDHPGRSGPEQCPVAADSLVTQAEDLRGGIHIQMARGGPLPAQA